MMCKRLPAPMMWACLGLNARRRPTEMRFQHNGTEACGRGQAVEAPSSPRNVATLPWRW